MGEQVYASITIRKSDETLARKLMEENHWPYFDNENGEENKAGLLSFSDSSVNFGNFDFEPALIAANIPYDKTFAAGPDWFAGEEYFRPGQAIREVTVLELHHKAEFLRTLKLIESGNLRIERVIECLKEEIEIEPLLSFKERVLSLIF